MPQVHKRFRIKKGIDLTKVTDLPHIITLMMFHNAILSSVRWHRSLNESSTFAGPIDRLFSIVNGAGWTAEAIRIMKEMKKKNLITDEDIRSLPEVQPLNPRAIWQLCLKPNVAFKRVQDIQDNGFAHFWNRNDTDEPKALAKKIISAVATEEYEPVYAAWIENGGKKPDSESMWTMAFFGIAQRVFGSDPSSQKVIACELYDAILSIGILLDGLIAVWCVRIGLELEPYPKSSLAEIA